MPITAKMPFNRSPGSQPASSSSSTPHLDALFASMAVSDQNRSSSHSNGGGGRDPWDSVRAAAAAAEAEAKAGAKLLALIHGKEIEDENNNNSELDASSPPFYPALDQHRVRFMPH